MAELIQYWDDTQKKYVEVSTTTPLPTSDTGTGPGGATEVQVTSANGDATTGGYANEAITAIGLVTNSRMMGINGANALPVTAANTSVDGVDPNAVGLAANSRLLGFNGTGWDRLRVDSSKNLIVSTGASFIPANTGAYGPDSSNALQAASLLFAYDASSNQYVSLHAENNRLFVLSPNNGTHGNAWSAAAVAANGTSTAIDCQYVSNISIFGNATAATTISIQFSQDNTNFYGNDNGNLQSITLTGAGDFIVNVPVGARYIRLKSSGAATITATIAGKA